MHINLFVSVFSCCYVVYVFFINDCRIELPVKWAEDLQMQNNFGVTVML